MMHPDQAGDFVITPEAAGCLVCEWRRPPARRRGAFDLAPDGGGPGGG